MGLEAFKTAVSILTEYMTTRRDELEDELKFASDTFSLYLINAESENITGFSEVLFRRTIDESLETATIKYDQEPDFISQQSLGNNSDAYSQLVYRKRRGSVCALSNPFAPIEDHPKPQEAFDFLYGVLSNTRLITRTMSVEQMKRLVSTMKLEEIKEGAMLVSQGEYNRKMYLIETGMFQRIKDGSPKAILRTMCVIGEISLLYSFPRTSSIVCLQDARVWSASADSYTAILMESQRKNRKLICSVLTKHTVYDKLSPVRQERVLGNAHMMHFSANEKIEIAETGVFILLSETCLVSPPGTPEKESSDDCCVPADKSAKTSSTKQKDTRTPCTEPKEEAVGENKQSTTLDKLAGLSIEGGSSSVERTVKLRQGDILRKGTVPLEDISVLFVPESTYTILELE